MTFIWATRGREWGFTFLRDGGFPDPRLEYIRAFDGLEHQATTFRHVGDKVALRFPDPENRQDSAGRPIPHEFVVFAPLASDIHDLASGRELLWPLVRSEYSSMWDSDAPWTTI